VSARLSAKDITIFLPDMQSAGELKPYLPDASLMVDENERAAAILVL